MELYVFNDYDVTVNSYPYCFPGFGVTFGKY
jgi:hypothetical protein